MNLSWLYIVLYIFKIDVQRLSKVFKKVFYPKYPEMRNTHFELLSGQILDSYAIISK